MGMHALARAAMTKSGTARRVRNLHANASLPACRGEFCRLEAAGDPRGGEYGDQWGRLYTALRRWSGGAGLGLPCRTTATRRVVREGL